MMSQRNVEIVKRAPPKGTPAVWLVRESKIARVRFYLEREQALEAAGLRD
jgi:hypothetical protein